LSDGVRLLHNKGDGKFEDVTQAVGIRREKVRGPDVCGLRPRWRPGSVYQQRRAIQLRGAPLHNVLWRNNGNSTFTDVSVETALGFAATGWVVSTDLTTTGN